ncbi:alpha/beta hydrolase [Curvibacter sp. APW13]|uniref:alpha/beta fold hydrolase n=1 Tax=Curvibacter sp. APW13 TaxID=3077236 RepID=UPI0028DD9870|nr:alpha/beta hydrolase [Curvibacter sp. APW13]MDT8991194.1 alpha/beta hydrolase [Curvibacter sp. APW13]
MTPTTAPLPHCSLGAATGPLLVYFHGAPGGLAEAQALQADAQRLGLRVICQERFAAPSALAGEAYFQALADDVARHAQGQPVDLVGFSIGTFVALQVARLLGAQVRSLHLVSAAAPLEGGDFLPAMAGRPVFQLAQRQPHLLRALTAVQGLLARVAPDALLGSLFASAQGADQALRTDPAFRQRTLHDLRRCFNALRSGYVRDVVAYVQPWHAQLRGVAAPTHLWHGDADNWSPPAMARYLQQQLPDCVECQVLPGLSHYSTLHMALPRIGAQIAGAATQ